MNWLNTTAILLLAFLAVFLESYFRGLRNFVGAQIDFLPALMVYASLSAGISTVALLGLGAEPLLGWGSLWQWLVMALGGAVATPLCFRVFDRFQRAFTYQKRPETSFRPDREIKRDRKPHLDH